MSKIDPISAIPTFQDSIRFMQFPNESKSKTDQCNELKESNELNQFNCSYEIEGNTLTACREIQNSENKYEKEAIETAIRVSDYASALSVRIRFGFSLTDDCMQKKRWRTIKCCRLQRGVFDSLSK